MTNGTTIKGNGPLPEIWILNESSEDGSGSSGRGGRNDNNTKIINTNANTNTNTGASVTVNSRAPKVCAIGYLCLFVDK